MIRAAFDIGGTFTDFVLSLPEGGLHSLKVPTTPSDPARAVLAGFERLLGEAGIAGADVDTVLHATTVATNAIIERKGSPTALITTRGFRDVLIIGRQKRYETYDLHMDKPAPLVPRRAIFEVDERLANDGEVVIPLDGHSLKAAVAAIRQGEFQSVAVCLLHAYANPEHERAIRSRLAAAAPGLSVSLSSEVSPKFREYERTSTTVANAYVRPIVDRYVARLQNALGERGFRHDLFIMQSNGGLVSPDFAREYPIRIVESGPAAGVLMAGMVGQEEGFRQVITFDMGGTTAKLGAIDDGEPAIAPTFEVDPVRYRKGSGLPISVPAIELLEIGAGGGSIASVTMGTIAVGPESAGADPGPICYGFGGGRATVTDANLTLGYLNPDWFNGGAMRLDAEGAAAGIDRDVGQALGLTTAEAAWGIHAVANSNMERAMRIVSVERGRDPRRYALVAFGGAGPLHAARLARALGIPRVIVPYGAGVGSAIGLLQADAKIDVSITRVMELTGDSGKGVTDIYAALERRAARDLDRLGMGGAPVWSRYAYMRYAGQGYEVRVDLPSGPIGADYAERAMEAFAATYEREYGYRDPHARIEAVDWYLVATLPAGGGTGAASGWTPPAGTGAPETGRRPAWFPESGGFVETPVIDRRRLSAGRPVPGPALIEEPDSTTVVLPGDTASVSARGHLVIEVGS